MPQNLAVSSITYDPNDTKTFYAGTGESYTAGDALGNGLWKSTDGGDSWNKIMGGDTQTSYVSEYNVVEIVVPNSNRTYRYTEASFGPSVPSYSPIVHNAILGLDAANDGDQGNGTGSDGCSSLSNASSVNGKIAIVDRGACYFATKTVNAQAAGAKLLIIVNNVDGPPVGMAAPSDGSVDLNAINYNQSANYDDGSCEYIEVVLGCVSIDACNYNMLATDDDGSCHYDCIGCTDLQACNYEEDNTVENGSCQYPTIGYDCSGDCLLDSDGDGVCDVYEVEGCTDLISCNFNSSATEDDNSCIYPDELYFDCNNYVGGDKNGIIWKTKYTSTNTSNDYTKTVLQYNRIQFDITPAALGVTPGDQVSFGIIENPGHVKSQFKFISIGQGSENGILKFDIHGKQYPPQGYFLTVDDQFSITTKSGPARENDIYNFHPRYDNPISNILYNVSPKKTVTWTSTAQADPDINPCNEQKIAWLLNSGFETDYTKPENDSLGIHLANINFRQFELHKYLSGSWVSCGSYSNAWRQANFNFVRNGSTIVCSDLSGGFLHYNEAKNWHVFLDDGAGTTVQRKVISNSEGNLSTTGKRAVINIDTKPSDPSSGNAYLIPNNCTCLLYTSPSPRDLSTSRMPSSA